MTSLRPLGWIAFFSLATSLFTTQTLAEPGCYDDMGSCRPAVSLGPCDATCPTGFCIGASCVDPEACALPCGTMGECPPLRLGNNTFMPEGGTGESCFYGTGCGGFTIDADALTTNDMTGRCLHAPDTGVVAALRGDCDGDQVPLVAEGVGQHCRLQLYVGPRARINTPTCNAGTCGAGCVSGFSPHGGSVCASDAASGYACSSPSECPSTFDVTATGCIPYVAGGTFRSGACFYGSVCGELGACFALDRADMSGGRWFEEAYLAGDCDMDMLTNADDPADCGAQVVVWTGTDPFLDAGTREGCLSSGLLCTIGDCSRLDLCAPGGAIGLACEPDNGASPRYCADRLGVDAECVQAGGAGADRLLGVCIPSEPADDSCGTRGQSCFATDPGLDPADSYHSGDCDRDGLINGVDPDVCVPESRDAGAMTQADAASPPEVDAGSTSTPDAGNGGLDAALEEGPDAGEPGRFAGSGCSCRAHAQTSSSGGLAALAALGLVLARRRRRRAH
jgi:MYXO-CTERM domain-containing protein